LAAEEPDIDPGADPTDDEDELIRRGYETPQRTA
jgi:hypothetical protein